MLHLWLASTILLSQVLQKAFAQVNGDAVALLNKLPVCGQSCLKGSLDKSETFGCNQNNLTCLCNNEPFGSDLQRGCKASCINITELVDTEHGVRDACAAISPKTEEVSVITSESSRSTLTKTRMLTITPVSFVFVTPTSPSNTPDGLDASLFSSSIPFGSASTVFPAFSPSVMKSLPPSFSPTANGSVLAPSHMPTSQKIGISVSIPIGVAIGIASFFLILHRCRRHRRNHDPSSGPTKLSPIITHQSQPAISKSSNHEPRLLNPSISAGAWVDGVWIPDIRGLTESPGSSETWGSSPTQVESPASLLKEEPVHEFEGEVPSFQVSGTDHRDRAENLNSEGRGEGVKEASEDSYGRQEHGDVERLGKG